MIYDLYDPSKMKTEFLYENLVRIDRIFSERIFEKLLNALFNSSYTQFSNSLGHTFNLLETNVSGGDPRVSWYDDEKSLHETIEYSKKF